ncbi:MAG: LptA/OstA family protein [Verrucomicrobiota bacterium]
MMKPILILALAAVAGFAGAQTNPPAAPPAARQMEINSAHGYVDGVARQAIYLGNVEVVDGSSRLWCEQLVVNLPAEGGRPTNIVAYTNVVVLIVGDTGATNRITSDKALYDCQVVGSVTNETITFTGGQPSPCVDNPQFTIYGDPLVLDVRTRKFSGHGYRTVFKQMPNAGSGTNNSSPLNIFK